MSMPKEPRQMMINMMYLVLTAMLALNVSSEILNAFNIINKGINAGVSTLISKNDLTYDIIKQQNEQQPGKAKVPFEKSQQARAIAAKLYNQIEAYKKEIETKADGYDPETKRLKDEKNIDIATVMFIDEGEGEKRGKQLQADIKNTAQQLVSLLSGVDGISKTDITNLYQKMTLKAEDNPNGNSEMEKKWYYSNFHSIPTVAALTLLSSIQQNIKTAEGDVIAALLNSIGKTDFKFDTLTAKVVPTSPTVVTIGQQFKAEAFLSAFNSKEDPEISCPGASVTVAGGKGDLTFGATSEGEKKYAGTITVKKNGQPRVYKFEGEYKVIKPFGSVSADKMNVFYIGVPNPVTVTAAGFTADKVSVSITQGTLTGANGKYTVTQSTAGKAMVNLSGTTADKKQVSLGGFEFRVKRIPDPVAKIASKFDGSIPASTLKATSGIAAVLEGFDFDCPFKVTKFSCNFVAKRADLQFADNMGQTWGEKVKAYIDRCKAGDLINFENIYAIGCDGTPRKLNSITFKIM
jgi:gliding motility-associated protein GldM